MIATFIGSPVAGGIVMAINYYRLGDSVAAGVTVVASFLMTVAIVVAAFLLPELGATGNLLYVLPQLLVAGVAAHILQGAEIEKHLQEGGRMVSGWMSLLIGILALPPVLVIVVGIFFVLPESIIDEAMYPEGYQSAAFGNDEVLYGGNATEEDARKLAIILKEEYFDDGGYSVMLDLDGPRATVGFLLIDGAWDDAETVQYYEGLGKTISGAFGSPLTVELLNDAFELQKTTVVE